MAQSNYYDSELVGFQSAVNPDYNKAELRELNSEIMEYAMGNTDFLMDARNITKIKESVNRPVTAYVKMRKPSTGGTAMTAFHTGIGGTSAAQTITWIALTEEFYFNETTGYDNVYDKASLFQNEVAQAQRNLRERTKEWLVQQLIASRTGYNPGGIVGASLDAQNVWQITGSSTPWANMASVLRQNKYGYSEYDIFQDPTLSLGFDFQMAQGNMNAQNLAYQLNATPKPPNRGGVVRNVWEDIIMGNPSLAPYPETISGGGAIVLPSNAFAFLPWMPKIYEDGSGDYEDYAGGYGIVDDAVIPGMRYMVHGWRTQADTTAGSGHGYTQDSVTQWQIGTYIAFMQQYASNVNETPIYLFGVNA